MINTMNFLCLKHKNEFVAIKNTASLQQQDPLKLLEILNDNNIDPRHAVIEFMKEQVTQIFLQKKH